jgi:hypothetical protein
MNLMNRRPALQKTPASNYHLGSMTPPIETGYPHLGSTEAAPMRRDCSSNQMQMLPKDRGN